MPRPTCFSVVITLLLIGCGTLAVDQETARAPEIPTSKGELTAIPQITSIPTISAWNILHPDVCTSPCWLGIMPGKTQGSVAEEILRGYYQIERMEKEANDTVLLRWQFIEGESLPGSTVIIRHDLVESIFLGIPVHSVSVDDVVSHFGEPEFVVWAFSERRFPPNGCGENMELSYSDYTLVVLPADPNIVSIKPSTPVVAIEYQSEFTLPSVYDWTPPIKWTGYDGEYCPPGGRFPRSPTP